MHRGLKSHIMEAFSIFKVSQAAAACKKERKENKHTHSHADTHKTISLITQFLSMRIEGFVILLFFFFFFLVFCNWLTSWCTGRQQAQERLPSRPIDLSSAHRVKVEGRRERLERQSLFLWQPAGACLGLFPVSSNCFSFSQAAAPCCSEEVRWSVTDI